MLFPTSLLQKTDCRKFNRNNKLTSNFPTAERRDAEEVGRVGPSQKPIPLGPIPPAKIQKVSET